jgi:hypothetical protein
MLSSYAEMKESGDSVIDAHCRPSFSARIGPANASSLVIRRSGRSASIARA